MSMAVWHDTLDRSLDEWVRRARSTARRAVLRAASGRVRSVVVSLPTPAVVGALAAATVGIVLGLRPLQDNSFLTHLATGRLILDRMAIPAEDVYSFTAAGSPWVVQSWLPSVLYALVERVGGDVALMLLRAVVTTALTLLLWRLTRRATSFGSRLLTVLMATVACAALWSPRPLLLGLVFLSLSVVVAEEDRWPTWALIPIAWLWVNSHGTFPLLLAYLAVRTVGRRLDGAPIDRHLRLLGTAAAGIVVGAVGPLGVSGLLFPVELLGRSEQLREIVEWRSPSFTEVPNLVFLALGLCALVLPRERRWEDLLPAAAFLALAATGLRHIPVATVVLVPAVARALPLRGSVAFDPAVRRAWRPLDVVVAASLTATCVLAAVVQLQRPAYDVRTYPVAELAWMTAEGLDPADVRVALPDYVGNYLTWRDGGAANVFMDDRFDMYPTHVVEAHRLLFAGERGWDAALDRYDIDAVLWPRKLPLAELVVADARWDVVHTTRGWIVATRRR